jgi:UDP-N-acetylmuramoyl-tripeptide--D-alanyl-D-alanine ligase
MFVALRGEHADGHDFVTDALERGAVAAMVSKPVRTDRIVKVVDTGRALLDLAADERRRLPDAHVLGITGANGKTSTKDLAAVVLGTRFRVHASPRSFNNEIGLPLTLLGVPEGTEVVAAEMGARREGDVALLCRIARPETVVVTNVGLAHMEPFGSWEAIVRAAAEPVRALDRDGIAILNADDPIVRSFADLAPGRVMTFGRDPAADVGAEEVSLDAAGRSRFALRVAGEREPTELMVPGEHMVSNALAAAACGAALGVTAAECAAALKGASISAWRMETFSSGDGILVVNDAYNANPESMAAGIRTARWMAQDGRLVVVLGHMAELGPIATLEHEKVGELLVRLGVDRLVTVGVPAQTIARAAIREGQPPQDVAMCDDIDDAIEEVRVWARSGDVLLVKGSRVTGLERVAEAFR